MFDTAMVVPHGGLVVLALVTEKVLHKKVFLPRPPHLRQVHAGVCACFLGRRNWLLHVDVCVCVCVWFGEGERVSDTRTRRPEDW